MSEDLEASRRAKPEFSLDFKRRLRTLIVDDDRTSSTLLASVVKNIGHEVVLASNAEEAIPLSRTLDPDLVILDVVLPGMDGVSALRVLKQTHPERWLPVILASVRSSTTQVLAGLQAGADDYLTKPFVLEQVVAKLGNVAKSLALHAQVRGALSFSRAVMDHMLEGLLCIDEGGHVIASNPAAEKMFGFEAGELRGVDVACLLVEGDEPRFAGVRGNMIGIGSRRDGTLFPFEAHHSELEIEGRHLTVVTLRDVSRQIAEERRVAETTAALREYRVVRETENELAHEMLAKLLHRGSLPAENVHFTIQAATGFSGDVVESLRSPSGKSFVMLADATGHGLAAAISLVPALSIFHAMVLRDCSLTDIVCELNTKLRALMPTERFLAAALIRLDESARSGEIWVGGVPSVWLIGARGEVVRRFDSTELPLGIVESTLESTRATTFSWQSSMQLVLTSDGTLEAENPEGEPFGEQRLLAAVSNAGCKDRLTCITDALRAHLAGLCSGDDASIAIVDLR